MKKILLFLSVIVSITSYSQDINSDSADSSSVVIHQDPRLELLISKQMQINEVTSRDSRKVGKGFRLMIISTSNREEAIAAKTKIYTYFPEMKAYLWHQSPYYKVKAGNFKDRKDAEAYQKKLNTYFPKGVFIMNDIVELRPDKNREEEY
jgi:hypothetical protein